VAPANAGAHTPRPAEGAHWKTASLQQTAATVGCRRASATTLPRWITRYGSLRSQGRPGGESFGRALPADADVFQQRRRHLRHLLAVGGTGDGDAGLVEGAGRAGLRIQIVQELGHQHAVLAL